MTYTTIFDFISFLFLSGLLLSMISFVLVVCWKVIPKKERAQFAFWSFFSLAGLSFYSLFFIYFFPDLVVYKDGSRYYAEMLAISENPFLWNPWLGEGPGYSVTAKMGYSWIVGFLMWLTNTSSILVPIGFNIAIRVITGMIVYVIALKIGASYSISLLAMLFANFYPDCLYWTARVLREPLSLFLICFLVLNIIYFFKAKTLKKHLFWGTVLLFTTISIILVRAQLGLFLPLSLIVWSAIYIIKGNLFKNIRLSFFIIASASFLIIILLPYIEQQILRAVSARFISLMDYKFWMENFVQIFQSMPRVLTLVAREEHGVFGYLLFPFTLTFYICLMCGIYKMFKLHSAVINMRNNAVMNTIGICFISLFFIISLAMMDSINIRFRSTIIPILSPIAAFGLYFIIEKYHLSTAYECLIKLKWLKT